MAFIVHIRIFSWISIIFVYPLFPTPFAARCPPLAFPILSSVYSHHSHLALAVCNPIDWLLTTDYTHTHLQFAVLYTFWLCIFHLLLFSLDFIRLHLAKMRKKSTRWKMPFQITEFWDNECKNAARISQQQYRNHLTKIAEDGEKRLLKWESAFDFTTNSQLEFLLFSDQNRKLQTVDGKRLKTKGFISNIRSGSFSFTMPCTHTHKHKRAPRVHKCYWSCRRRRVLLYNVQTQLVNNNF